MSAAEAEVEVSEDPEHERIERWRVEELERAGYAPAAAAQLAVSHEVDLHAAVDLLAHGCPADLAVRILI